MQNSESKHDVFQAIADPTRRRLLQLLSENEMSIASITKCFSISRTAINKHLKVLSEAGLVTSQRMGRETRYKLKPEPLSELKQWLSVFDQYWTSKLFDLKKYVESDDENQ
ncbi:ArsR/SmtB family transcription factor [Heyndrickxia vini]|uniref:Winged helix-turn-helix transcriptional regulator n=1 Tax=Heyndrickxia vini TaxID=1476025 RepID=A0ABX7E113_9BACI|nr:metalloregulator ArsR/SmtB family transcription factor [Heyndrickxia vini]QQZ08930.1 winged helix-turn-helix transcriptional regulator [Heyndrickxia vini]